jgi:cathepsin L
MKLLLALALCVLVVADRPTSLPSFEEFLSSYGKNYNGVEYARRKTIFESNMQKIREHNADLTQTWWMDVNQFADLTVEEFRANYLGNTVTKMAGFSTKDMPYSDHSLRSVPVSQLPDKVDWREKNVVTPVKNQGSCGSCWAFATTEGVESCVALATGKLLTLSAQDVTSCTKNPQHCGGTGGCGGATAELGFEQVAKGGIALEKDYPYTAQTGTCKTAVTRSAKVKGFVKLIENNYTDLVNAIATVGPIAVSVAADPWMMYGGGVFTGCPAGGTRQVIINHAVQLVGYGVDAGKDYWIVRNSWGAGWGERGYIRMLKHSDGDKSKWCNPDNRPQDGSGCDGGPASITVCGSCGIWYDSCYATGCQTIP